MTETQDTETCADLSEAAGRANSIWTELGPTLSFIVIYNVMLRFPEGDGLFTKDTALYWATGVLIIATLVVIIMKLVRGERVPPFLIISSSLIGLFGTAGILLQSKLFLFIKPTIINLLFAGVIFGGLAVGRNIWKMLFHELFDLPDFAWRTLAIRWGLYFVAMAAWNEFLWRTYVPGFEAPVELGGLVIVPAGSYEFLGLVFGAKDAEGVWANWKLGSVVIGLVFAIANTPYTLKHLRQPAKTDD